jgi:hypothetical protein
MLSVIELSAVAFPTPVPHLNLDDQHRQTSLQD